MVPLSFNVFSDWPYRSWRPKVSHGWDKNKTTEAIILQIGPFAFCGQTHHEAKGIKQFSIPKYILFRWN